MNSPKLLYRILSLRLLFAIATGSLGITFSACTKVHTFPGTQLVACRIVKPDGSDVKDSIYTSIMLENGTWSRFVQPDLFGKFSLPAINSQDKNTPPKEYFCYISNANGYFVTTDSSLIHENSTIKLKSGGLVNILWMGSNLSTGIFSFESYSVPQLSSGISPDYRDLAQRPPGPFVIGKLIPGGRYTKYGMLKADETITLELGKSFRNYEIICLLPPNLPKDLRLFLSLQANPAWDSEIKPYFFLFSESARKKIPDIAEEGLEIFFINDLPIDNDGGFRFIADENWAKVTVFAKRENEILPLQNVEFNLNEDRRKTVDLRDNEQLLLYCSY
ncbi:MAG: hypothetical protein LBM70_10135 [Victivallales bacterium]|jgi:hypothetical protein|nr:hypothetical protein [Victivallales bacterium]